MIDQRQLRLLVQLIGILSVIAIVILSLVPGDVRPHTGTSGKIEHVIAYCLTAALLGLGFRKIRSLAIIVLFLSMLSGAVEIAQIYIPGRQAELSDFVASTAGAFVGVVLAWIVLRAGSAAVAR